MKNARLIKQIKGRPDIEIGREFYVNVCQPCPEPGFVFCYGLYVINGQETEFCPRGCFELIKESK